MLDQFVCFRCHAAHVAQCTFGYQQARRSLPAYIAHSRSSLRSTRGRATYGSMQRCDKPAESPSRSSDEAKTRGFHQGQGHIRGPIKRLGSQSQSRISPRIWILDPRARSGCTIWCGHARRDRLLNGTATPPARPGTLTLVVFASESVDPTKIDPSSLRFHGVEALATYLGDVNATADLTWSSHL